MTAGESVIAGRAFGWSVSGEMDWERVYAEELPRVYNFFRYRVGDGPEAEDLTAATFERAWQARGRYRRDRGGFATWLFAIVRNLAIDHYRRRREHAPLESSAHVASGPTPEELASQRSDAARLSTLLNALGDRERELIALKYGAELTNREIARTLKLSESNVGTLLHSTIQSFHSDWFTDGATR
jgi:RNA polymerase sigma-70 factor (ECF subfamily)